jgi:hypothetical protein
MAARNGELKPTLSVSVPSDQRGTFYAALTELKRHDERIFVSASTLIVEAVLAAAERMRTRERARGAASSIARARGTDRAGGTRAVKGRASA